MVVVIKHASLTGAAANPDVMVDGPKWDADHTVTGLESVDNTSDVDKPVSTAQAAADAVVAANAANASNLTSGTVAAARMPAFTGDITTSAGAVATTLATVNANVGTFGSATQTVQVTFNAKGLATAASNVTVTPAIGSVTGLGTGVATFLATPSSANLRAALTDETGTGVAYFVGGALGTPSSGTATNLLGLPVSGLAAQAAYTFVGNSTGSSAVPTAVDIAALTTKASPAAGDYVIVSDQAASGAWKKATIASVGSAGAVSSFNTRTGSVVPVLDDYTYSGNTMRLPPKWWSGGQHSNNVSAPTTKIDIAAGVWRDSTDAFNIIGSSVTLDTGVVGAANGLDASGTWTSARGYTFAISKADGTFASLASLSPTAPTLPSGYVYFRRIGMFKTDSSGFILAFTHVNNAWYYSTAIRDVSSVSFIANTLTTRLLPSVPAVQGVTAIIAVTSIQASGTSCFYDLMPGFLPSTANTGWRIDIENTTGIEYVHRMPVDSSGQIKYRAGTVNHTVTIDVAGWIDDL